MLLDSDMSALVNFKSNLENHHKSVISFWCQILYYNDMVD